MNEIISFYNSYAEDDRLKIRRSRILERITTLNYINKYVNKNFIVADIGAGTGVYTFELAGKVKSVFAVDLVQEHVDEINDKARISNINNVNAICESAISLKSIESDSYDMVLCLGPMYHIKEKSERLQCINECKRISKKNGVIFIAYINKVLAMNYFVKNKKYLNKQIYEEIELGKTISQKGFDQFLDISFFTDPSEIEEEAILCELKIEKNLGTDGISYFIQDQIEDMNNEQWDVFVRMHERHCEDKNSFGMSMHGLVICRK